MCTVVVLYSEFLYGISSLVVSSTFVCDLYILRRVSTVLVWRKGGEH